MPARKRPFHASEITEWKKCRRSHNWKYNEGLYANTVAAPLEMGTALHAMMAMYYDPAAWHDKVSELDRFKNALDEFKRINDLQKEQAIETNGTPLNIHEIDSDYSERYEVAQSMLSHWTDKGAEDFDKDMEPVATELSMSHTFKNGVTIEGKIDALFKSARNDKIWIVDWKHVSTFRSDIEVRLEMDEQINMYFALLYLNGFDIAGFKYVERIKAKIGPPKKLERRFRGKLFSTDKTQCTTYEIAKEVFESEDNEAYSEGLYDDYLGVLQRVEPELTRVTTIRRNEATIKRYIKELKIVISEMQRKNMSIFGANNNVCQWCSFKQACNELVRGGDVQSMLDATTKVKQIYYEREF